jgi:RDD family
MRSMDGQVWVEDSVDAPRPPPAERLRDRFMTGTEALTMGLVRARGRALVAGPVELLRFGEPETTPREVSWPIEGGVLAAEPGGRLRVSIADTKLVARVEGYRPSLPLPLYRVTQLPLHHALVRLVLLRLRGRQPAAGVPADVSRRLAAGAIDAGICAGIALLVARRGRLRAFAAFAAGYHVAAWSVSGRTIGGALMRQRVVAIDGSAITPVQAVLRFIALPFALVRFRAVHDEVASTDVVTAD